MRKREILDKYFEQTERAGWVSLKSKRIVVSGFGTQRFGKLVAEQFLQFSIGATQLGNIQRLNDTIRGIISFETDIVESHSTDGSASPKKQYPGFDIQSVDDRQLERILTRIEGAVLHAMSAKTN